MKLTPEMCQAQFDSLRLDEKRWLCCIIQEYHSAREKHPEWPMDFVHGAAIVGEEAGELIRSALNYEYGDEPFFHMHKEAIQTAATGLRFCIETGEDNPKSNYLSFVHNLTTRLYDDKIILDETLGITVRALYDEGLSIEDAAERLKELADLKSRTTNGTSDRS